MVTTILYAAVIGGVAGYMTNDWALRLMFGGVRLGDRVIVRAPIACTKDKLAERLGETVEEQLLRPEADGADSLLLQRLQQAGVSEALCALIADFLSKRLPEQLRTLPFGEIDGYQATMDGFAKLLDTFLEKNGAALLGDAAAQLPVDSLLDETQRRAIASEVVTLLAELLPESELGECLCAAAQSDQTLQQLLGEAQATALCEALSRRMADTMAETVLASPDAAAALLRQANLNDTLTQALRTLLQQPLSALLGRVAIGEFVALLQQTLPPLLHSPQLRQVLEALCSELLDALREAKIPLATLVPVQEQHKCCVFLAQRLPELLPRLQAYLGDKREALDAMIDETVGEVIRAKTSNPFANVVRRLFRELIAEKLHEVDVIASLEHVADTLLCANDRAVALEQLLSNYLHKTTVGGAVSTLEAHGLLSSALLANGLISLADQFAGDLPPALPQKLGQLRLAEVLGDETLHTMAGALEGTIAVIAVRQLPREQVEAAITVQAKKLLQLPLSQLIPAEARNTLRQAGTQAADLLRAQQQAIAAAAEELLVGQTAGKTVSDLLPQSARGGLCEAARGAMRKALGRLTDKLRPRPAAAAVEKLAKTDAAEKSSRWLLRHVLPGLVRDKLQPRRRVAENVRGMSDAWICRCMQDFMGRELKPLCLLGLLLGLVTGAGIGAADSFGTLPLPARLIGFALIGVATNYLAFWGLFRPYERQNWLIFWKQGYIPRNKRRVAKGFATFVEEKLLDTAGLQQRLADERETIIALLVKLVGELDADKLQAQLQPHMQKLADAIAGALTDYAALHGVTLAEAVTALASEQTLGELLPDARCAQLGEQTAKLLTAHAQTLAQALLAALASCKLEGVLPAAWRQEQLKNWLSARLPALLEEQLTPERLRAIAAAQQERYARWQQQPLSSLLGEAQATAQPIAIWLTARLFTPASAAWLSGRISGLLMRELDAGQTVGTVLGGRVWRYLEDHLENVTERLLDYLQQQLSLHRWEIIEGVRQTVAENVGIVARLFLDADDLVEHTVSLLIDERVPAFLAPERQTITAALTDFCRESIFPLRLVEMQLDLRTLPLDRLIGQLLQTESLRGRFYFSAERILTLVLQLAGEQPIALYTGLCRAESLPELCDRLDEPLTLLLRGLRRDLADEPFCGALTACLDGVLRQAVLEQPLGVWGTEVTPCLATLLQQTAPAFAAPVQHMLQQLAKTKHDTRLDTLFDRDHAAQALAMQLAQQATLQPVVTKWCAAALDAVAADGLQFAAPETRRQLAKLLSEALLDALCDHMDGLLAAVDIREVTEQVVRRMSSREIHQMFNAFAGGYFRLLIALGAVGVLFAAPQWQTAGVYLALIVLTNGVLPLLSRKLQKGE